MGQKRTGDLRHLRRTVMLKYRSVAFAPVFLVALGLRSNNEACRDCGCPKGGQGWAEAMKLREGVRVLSQTEADGSYAKSYNFMTHSL